MLSRSRFLVALAALAAPLLAAGAASAQTIMVAQAFPNRFIGTQNVTGSERPSNLKPSGVSYSDCLQDLALQFPLILSAFTGQSLQIWASATQSCQTDVNRGKSGTPPVCWQLSGGATAINQPTTYSTTVSVRVQDLVGPQLSVPTSGAPVNWGVAACQNQPSFAAVPITLSFVPVSSAGIAMGTGVDVTVQTDLVGPPAPTGITESVGDSLFNLGWTANTNTDTAGYDIYVAANGAGAPVDGSASSDASSLNVLVCPDASNTGSSSSSSSSGGSSGALDGGDSSADAPDDGSGAAAETGASDASIAPSGCHYEVAPSSSGATGSLSNTGTCMSTALSQGFVTEGGSTTTASVYDDAGNLIDGGQVITGGGISQIPASYLVGSNGTTTMTISGESVSAYTISGLKNGLPGYTVVISAVDGFGNIGPPSSEVCDFPAPVNDFYKTYRLAGGRAGGGFCTLEAVGEPVDVTVLAVPVAALVFGLARRKRRRAS